MESSQTVPAGAAGTTSAEASPAPLFETSTAAPAVRYVKRGRFRVAEPVPDHLQAAWQGLPVHGLKATTVRELLQAMAHVMLSMDYKRRHHPDTPVSEAVQPWYAYYAAQAKAVLWACRDLDDINTSAAIPPPVVVSAEDCRARYLDLFGDGRLSRALVIADADVDRAALSEAAYRLFEDLRYAGTVPGVEARA